MPTIHIESEKNQIAKRVLMPGDPNRAYLIATKFLTNVKMVNKLRGELAFTGKYKDVPITIFSSGMGIGSMGIYSYELFKFYDVDTIIRVGTTGSYVDELNINDVVVVDSAYSNSCYDIECGLNNVDVINSSFELNATIIDTAAIKSIPVKQVRAHTCEAFYSDSADNSKYIEQGCKVVEMESYALLYNAKKFMKKATSLLTVTDKLTTHEKMDPKDRERKMDDMIILALESIIKM